MFRILGDSLVFYSQETLYGVTSILLMRVPSSVSYIEFVLIHQTVQV